MAAQETGALKEAKDKLEKQLEELTWRLQLEKRLRVNLEEAKAQEALKYQNSLEAMQKKLDEANAMAVEERKAARKAIDEAPSVVEEKEIVVEDTKKVESLTAEVNELKALSQSEKQRADDLKECSEERRKKLEETEKKVVHLQESMSRLEEKLNNLELENKVFRQQAVSMAPNKFLSGRSRSIIIQRNDSSGRLTGDTRASLDLSPSMNQRDVAEIDDKPQQSLNEKQMENQELLIRCIAQHLGFAGNIPIADCIIYKCLQWRSFEVEKTTVFDRIIQTIGNAIEKTQDNNDVLAYWLSNASTLLLLLQRTLKASGVASRKTPPKARWLA